MICFHEHYSWPRTVVTKQGFRKQTYVVCLDCCREVQYDLVEMRIKEKQCVRSALLLSFLRLLRFLGGNE